jgi:hypothetical protein
MEKSKCCKGCHICNDIENPTAKIFFMMNCQGSSKLEPKGLIQKSCKQVEKRRANV